MRLFHSPNSPFVRKVEVLLIESGLTGQVDLVPVSGNPLNPGTLPVAENPLGKIPALDLGDGQVLHDSRVICRYLDTLAGGGFYPEPPDLWRVLTLESVADGICDAAVLMAYEARLRPEPLRFADWTEAQWAKIARALDALEAGRIGPLDGPLTLGQIALGAALGYLDLRHGARDWRAGRPALAAWFAAFSLRPSMQATLPPG